MNFDHLTASKKSRNPIPFKPLLLSMQIRSLQRKRMKPRNTRNTRKENGLEREPNSRIESKCSSGHLLSVPRISRIPRFQLLALAALVCWLPVSAPACDLCAITGAEDSRLGSSHGWVATIAEQFIRARDLRFDGESFSTTDAEYLDSSMTHFVLGYNFHSRFGLSVNAPFIYRRYRYYEVAGAKEGSVRGLGDIAVVGRWTAFTKTKDDWNWRVNLLGGVKLPTGSDDFVRLDAEREEFFDRFFPAGHDHAISGVHPHDLALGSGSFEDRKSVV